MKVLTNWERCQELEEAVDWLSERVATPPSSRFPIYLKIWKAICNGSDLPSGGTSSRVVEEIIDEFGELQYRGAVHEAFQLVGIHKAFKNEPEIIPVELLKKVVKGRFSELEEDLQKSQTSSPRNFLFELTVAAMFKRSGLPVVLTEEADVEFNFRNYRVFVECKRLSSFATFERNFSKANNQLVNRFAKFGYPVNRIGHRPVGMIILGVTKAINPTQSYMSTPSLDAARRLIDEEISNTMEASESIIREKQHRNICLLGFYNHIQLMLPGDFGSFTRWSFFPGRNLDLRSARVASAIINKLKSA